jgi:C-methyltransferase-like protein/methyltransferase family protein/putative zinc binding protein
MRENCRVCGSALRDVLHLGDFAPSDFVREQAELQKVPLTLAECAGCALVQLRHTLDRDLLYRNYWYFSGLNPSMVASLRDVVEGVQRRVELEPGDTVVDIGANDGTLLTLYKEKLNKVGFDPAVNLAPSALRVCDLFVNDYFETASVEIPPAKAITSIAMFYDLDEPRKFVERVRDALHQDGVWVVQMTDLVRMLRANAFDNICHEHLCYYSLRNFSTLVEDGGLQVFDVEFNDVNGGSLRAYVGHEGARYVSPSVAAALADESEYLGEDAVEQFSQRVQEAKRKVLQFVEQERAHGKVFHALGASTKGNTLLQYFGLTDQQIACAAEVNPSKYGLRTVGSNVPIVSQEESLADKPDYYLVLPWHFIDFFLRKHAGYIFSGGVLLTPLPEPTLHRYDARHL